MADRIIRPQGLGLTFAAPRAVGSPYGNSGAAMANAAKILANTPDKTSVGLQKLAEGIKGIGSGIRQYKDDQQQAGLQRVLQGKDFNAPSVWDRITATMGHVANGTLGQHAGERTAIRSTPMDRNPQNIVIGPDGRLSYNAGLGNKGAYEAERLKQAQIDTARMQREEAAAAKPRAPMRGENGQPHNPPGSRAETAADRDPLPTKDGPQASKDQLYPGSNMKVTTLPDGSPDLSDKGPGAAGFADAGKVVVPEVAIPGLDATATAAGSPMADPAEATVGGFDYEKAANNRVALRDAVTPGGNDLTYSSSGPLDDSSFSPGDAYNSFDQPSFFGNSLAQDFGPAPFSWDQPYEPSTNVVGSDYYSYPGESPLSDMPDVPVETPVVPAEPQVWT